VPGSPVPARHRCSCTTPGSIRSAPAKKPETLGVGTRRDRSASLLVVAPHGLGHLLRVDIARGVGDDQVTARRHGGEQPADEGGRVVLVRDAVQDPQEHDRDRLIEIQHPGRLRQDLVGVPQVTVDVGGRALGPAGQEGTGVQQHDRDVGEHVVAGFPADVGPAFGVDDVDQPAVGADVRGRDGRGGGLAAPGAGRDEQVGFFVLQVRDPLVPAGQGGQVDLVGGQVVPAEPGQPRGCGRVGPYRLVRAERAGQVAAQVPADDLVDVLLPGRIGFQAGG